MQKKFLLLLISGVFLLGSCRKDPDLSQLSTNFVVTSNTDETVSFSSYKTYFISDTVAAYVSTNPKDSIITDSVAAQLVAAVKQNMSARGYTFVPLSSHPDLGITMGVAKNVNATTVYPGWWDGWAGWVDPWYWGWYYPYYYPWSVTYVITTGSVVIDMIDLKNAVANQTERVIWSSLSGGALGTNGNSNLQRGVNAINQAFKQSPLVKAN